MGFWFVYPSLKKVAFIHQKHTNQYNDRVQVKSHRVKNVKPLNKFWWRRGRVV